MRPLQGLGALVLTLCSTAAMALGLGDIRVLSKPGQPLLAEIPVISNEPGELENARVALASPATFARVGLERPQGLVGDLQFQFAQDARGRAVIRVTSRVPVDRKAVAFLIEVDWGQGRLVREYSALVEAPDAAAAPAAPAIEAPRAGADNAIVRAPAPTNAAVTPTSPSPSAASSARATPAPPSPARAGAELTPVRQGQTLSQIAVGLARGNGHSLDQTMLALLRTNPDAFIDGNINRLKQGAVLRTPQQEALSQIGAAEAAAMVREQAAQWRQARAPVPQPAEAGATAAPRPAAAGSDGARLEIAPALASDAKNAGATSGTRADGEGDMAVNEQLQQAREDVATRDAEIQELRTRVSELEKLKQQQQALIALKDTDLAAAQRRLAQAPAGTADMGGFPLWLIGGLVLLLAALGAWLASRRRKPSPLPPLPRQEPEPGSFAAVAAAEAAAYGEASTRHETPDFGEHEPGHEGAAEFEYADVHEQERAPAYAEPEATVPEPEPSAAPTLPVAAVSEPVEPTEPASPVAPVAPVAEPEPELEPEPEPERSPPPVYAAAEVAAPPEDDAEASAAGRDRLELAVAYLDLGDAETARSLLLEVAAGGDPRTRAEAQEILGRMG